ALALHRFGLGPRPGSIAAIASDPRGALIAELDRPGGGRIDDRGFLTSAEAARAGYEARAQRRAEVIVAERARKEAEQQGMSSEMARAEAARPEMLPQAGSDPTPERRNILKEINARIDAALDADIGFVERLVWFWSNHFCVSAYKVPNRAGGYE